MTNGSFLISISGQIEYITALTTSGTSWHCKYELITGPDWKIVGGLELGLSQTVNITQNCSKIVLNYPIDIVYKSSNIFGWPQLILSVYEGFKLKGYGRIHIPIQTGVHLIDVSLARPQPSSLLGYFGTFFGYQPELLEPKMLAEDEGIGLIRMISSGEIRCSLNILTQNLVSLGYDVGLKRN
ncbi:B9 domain-containing protein 1 [Onthophagus taurus]|uniref:B9 domain-containing protein 1 n=1 Tax=Onthophagus taurus TaxID=166361 RepID=UPI000C20A7D0|nr:B9 domain-containing protein 1 [Onthophagus taurus]